MNTEKHPLTLDTLRRDYPCGHYRGSPDGNCTYSCIQANCPGYSITAVLTAWEADRAHHAGRHHPVHTDMNGSEELDLVTLDAARYDELEAADEEVATLQTELQRYREALERVAKGDTRLVEATAIARQALTHNENKEPG